MRKSLCAFSLLTILVIASIFIAGCSDSTASTEPQSSETVTVAATAASTAALYSAGDIVKNPKSTTTSGLLILGFDASADTYERAYIYPNSDGSWGYRINSKTEKLGRSTIETLYTEKVGTVEVSAVPIGTPTTITTVASTTTKTTTIVTTATTSSAAAPKITDIDPVKGPTGATVSITALEGKNFVSGATVSLVKSGETSISASGISVSSPELITCTFAIPADAGTGIWDVVIKNPDGQSYTWKNGFTVTQGSTTATTTTTSSTTSSGGLLTMYSVSPPKIYLGVTINSQEIDIGGTNLSSASNLKLVSSSYTMTATSYSCPNTQAARAFFTIPAGYEGTYTIQAVDSHGNVLGSLANGLIIE